jgi:hypothetical protein
MTKTPLTPDLGFSTANHGISTPNLQQYRCIAFVISNGLKESQRRADGFAIDGDYDVALFNAGFVCGTTWLDALNIYATQLVDPRTVGRYCTGRGYGRSFLASQRSGCCCCIPSK